MPNEPALPIPTVTDILSIALRKAGIVGIGEAIETTVLNDAFSDANDLLAQWQRNRYLVYHLVDYSKVSTGATSYSVGRGMDFNISPRPDRAESGFFRILNSPNSAFAVDIPMDIIPSMEDYNRIAVKNLGLTTGGVGGSISWRVFYDPAWPVGVLKPWPIAQAALYEIHVTFKETLNRFRTLQDQVNLPPEYSPALKFCLARVLRASYQMPPDTEINHFARRALNAIRLANVAVPTLTMPRAVSGRKRAYDYRGDT